MLFLRKSNFWFFSCTTPLFYSLVCSSHCDNLILCSPSCIHKCFSSNSRQPDVPQTQPKPAVPAPPEAAPVAKSWANTKPGGQDGECCSGWRGSALDIRLRDCAGRDPHTQQSLEVVVATFQAGKWACPQSLRWAAAGFISRSDGLLQGWCSHLLWIDREVVVAM